MSSVFNIRTAQVASIVVGIALCAGSVIGANNDRTAFESQYQENQNQIAKLEKQVEESSDFSVNYVTSTESATTLLNSASDLGKEVCDKQNEMFGETDTDKIVEDAEYVGERLTESSRRYQGTWLLGIKDDVEWEFCTTYDFTGASFPVVWLAHSKTDGALLGYATAEYVADTHQFDKLKVTMTYEGTQRVGAEEAAAETDDAPDEAAADEGANNND